MLKNLNTLLFTIVFMLSSCLSGIAVASESTSDSNATASETKAVAQTEATADVPESYEISNVTASGNDGNVEKNTIDGIYETRWSAEGINCWIMFELKEELPVGYLGIAFYNGDERSERFAIEFSSDGNTFTEIWNGQSDYTSDMMAYDTKGESAKYVRLMCNGNTLNLWNSITEVRIYPPHPDGLLIVEEVADEAKTELTPEAKVVYDKAVLAAKDLMLWVADMYDPYWGGFAWARSGKEIPQIFGSEIECMAFALGQYKNFGILEYIPDELRQDFVTYVQERQNPETGFFADPQHAASINTRQLSRNIGNANKVFGYLGGEPLYLLPGERAVLAATESTEAASVQSSASTSSAMPSYMDSPDAYLAWINSLPWDENPWNAGDLLFSSTTYVALLPEEEQADYWKTSMDFVVRNQNPATGMWGGENISFTKKVSGVFKVLLYFKNVPEQYRVDSVYWYPNIDVMYDYLIANLSDYEHEDNLGVRNIMSAIIDLKKQFDPEKLDRDKDFLIEFLCNALMEYQMPDGSFSTQKGFSYASSGSGYDHCLGLDEGCMDVVQTPYTIITFIKLFYDVSVPQFDEVFANTIWNNILTEKYDFKNKTGKYEGWEPLDMSSGTSEDFQSFDYGLFKTDTPLKYTITAEDGIRPEIVPDIYNLRNRVLLLNKPAIGDTTLEGLTFRTFAGDNPGKIKITYRLMFERTNNIYMWVKAGTALDFRLSPESGGVNLTVRKGTSTSQYLATTFLDAEKWHNICYIYTPPTDETESHTEVWVDCKQIYSGSEYWDGTETGAPKTISSIGIQFFENGFGDVYVDDIRVDVEK